MQFICYALSYFEGTRENVGKTAVFVLDDVPSKNIVTYFNHMSEQYKVVLIGVGKDVDYVDLQNQLVPAVYLVTDKTGEFEEFGKIGEVIYPSKNCFGVFL